MAQEPLKDTPDKPEKDARDQVDDIGAWGTDRVVDHPEVSLLDEGCYRIGAVTLSEHFGWES